METRFKEGNLDFTIRRCQVGDETSLSLLGKATLLETYADSTHAVDLLEFVEAEHSAERYRSWLKSNSTKIWVAETTEGGSAIGYTVALTTPNAPRHSVDCYWRVIRPCSWASPRSRSGLRIAAFYRQSFLLVVLALHRPCWNSWVFLSRDAVPWNCCERGRNGNRDPYRGAWPLCR